jgi:hypothetical protein
MRLHGQETLGEVSQGGKRTYGRDAATRPNELLHLGLSVHSKLSLSSSPPLFGLIHVNRMDTIYTIKSKP